MASIKPKKETKVLPFKEKTLDCETKEQRLKRLQEMIDQGTYDHSADFIAKAYLHKTDNSELEKTKKPQLKNTSHNSHTMKKKQ